MMRLLAATMLRLYPRAWRRRYAEEVGDLLASRPVRARTVTDLARGAFDAWINRRLIPGGSTMRVPVTPIVLTVSTYALLNLWNPGIRHVPSLHETWNVAMESSSTATLGLAAVATFLFAATPAFAAFSLVSLFFSAATKRAFMEGRGLLVLTLAVAFAMPIWGFTNIYYGMTFFDLGFPVGPLGNAITGGFFAPLIIVIALGLRGVANGDPLLGAGVHRAGRLLSIAAALNMVAWVPALLVLTLGASGASTPFVVAVLASVLCSVGISVVIIRSCTRPEPSRHLVQA